MPVRPSIAIFAGALATVALAFAGAASTAQPFADALAEATQAETARAGADGLTATFTTINGWATRHPLLEDADDLPEKQREDIAQTIAALPGVGGIRWADGTMMAESSAVPLTPMHCQKDVEALLRARTIRFEESSSSMDVASRELLDEVEAALRPCLGSIIAITGHTDNSGPEPGNIALSKERANAVRNALLRRGIPRDGLRAVGVGSSKPVDGFDPADPANRRIEFSVIATEPLKPTPVDTPGAR